MPRKEDAHTDELEGVAQRLRDERPQASPLDLDRIKTTAMARAKSGAKGGRAGARRLAVAGLTVGLLVATTGGVLAGEGGHGKGKGSGSNGGGNAANAQYGGECNIQNGSGNVGDNNGQGSENNACNENTFITETTTDEQHDEQRHQHLQLVDCHGRRPRQQRRAGSYHDQESNDQQQAREDPHQRAEQVQAA